MCFSLKISGSRSKCVRKMLNKNHTDTEIALFKSEWVSYIEFNYNLDPNLSYTVYPSLAMMASAFCAHFKITYPGKVAVSNVSCGYSCSHCHKFYFLIIQSYPSLFPVRVRGDNRGSIWPRWWIIKGQDNFFNI